MMGSKTRASATELASDGPTREEREVVDGDAQDVPTRSPRARTRAQVYLSTLGWLLCAVVGTGIYSNVIADPSSLRDFASSLARRHAGCVEPCRVLHMEERRSVFGYRADYDMDGRGPVHVTCRRTAIVLGNHQCETH